jgi:hypothetical protein
MLEHLVKVLRRRIRGVPGTPGALNYSLQTLSVMRGWAGTIPSADSSQSMRRETRFRGTRTLPLNGCPLA